MNSRRMMARMVRHDRRAGATAARVPSSRAAVLAAATVLDDRDEGVFERRLDAFEAVDGDGARLQARA